MGTQHSSMCLHTPEIAHLSKADATTHTHSEPSSSVADPKRDADKTLDASLLIRYLQPDKHEHHLCPGFTPKLCFSTTSFPSSQPAWLQSGMPSALAAVLHDSAALLRFLETPVPESLGMVQMRLFGDHTEDHLWLAFDYLAEGEEPSQDQSILSCVRVPRRPLYERRRRYQMRGGPSGVVMGRLDCSAAGVPLISRDQRFTLHTIKKGLLCPSGSVTVTQPFRGPKQFAVSMQRPQDTVTPFSSEGSQIEASAQLSASTLHEDTHHTYQQKQPTWNDRSAAYVLNFNGRVTKASSKNLMLLSPYDSVHDCADDGSALHEDSQALALRFGRVAAKTPEEGLSQFSMDVAYPMSPLQAAGVAMSSLLSNVVTF